MKPEDIWKFFYNHLMKLTKLMHTGDIGYMDEDGFLFIEGRMKRMIMTIHDGVVYKIAPTQTEKVLNSHKKVKDSRVVGFSNGNDVVLKAFIIAEDKVRTFLI